MPDPTPRFDGPRVPMPAPSERTVRRCICAPEPWLRAPMPRPAPGRPYASAADDPAPMPRPDSSIAAARIAAAGHRRIPRMGSGETRQKRASWTLSRLEVRLCWQDATAIRSRTARHGNTYLRCVPGPLTAATYRRNALSTVRRWQDAREMRSRPTGSDEICTNCVPQRPAAVRFRRGVFLGGRPWQYSRAMRSQAPGCGDISTLCVPQRPTVASFSLHASPKGPRTGKAPLPGNISPPCIQNELALAIFARHVSEKCCKAPFGNA